MKVIRLIVAMVIFIAPSAWAVTIYGVATKMLHDKSSTTQKIANLDENSAHMITIKVDRIGSPEKMDVIKSDSEDELLFTPARILLSPNMDVDIKFFYKGLEDDVERYYRLRWIDEVMSDKATGDNKNVQLDARAIVDTVLVVEPRKRKYAYEFKNNTLFNNGNVSMFISGYGDCTATDKKGDTCKVVRPILPGSSMEFNNLDLMKNGYLGYWESEKFVPIDLNQG